MKRKFTTILTMSLGVNGFVVLAYYLSVAPVGTSLLMGIATFSFVAALLSVLLIPTSLILVIPKSTREIGFVLLCGSVAHVVVSLAAYSAATRIRHDGFRELAVRSRPLVAAIEEFEKTHGRSPAELSELVPDFLPEVPLTGIGAFPRYKFEVVNDPTMYEGNPWVITVPAPSGIMSFDQFMYLPHQNYPPVGYGGVLERIEDWAYVHE